MFRDFDQSTVHDTTSVISQAQNKDYYKKNKITGVYKQYDPITGDLTQEGEFQRGVEVGLWKLIDEDGHQQHFRFRQERVGALCGDGSYSSATGKGACSWHGGVAQWLTQNKKYQVGGTGKYEPIETRILKGKQKLKEVLKININKSDQQLLVNVIDKLLKNGNNQQNQSSQKDEGTVAAKVASFKSQYENRIQELQEIQVILDSQNDELKRQKKQLQSKLGEEVRRNKCLQRQKKSDQQIKKIKAHYEKQLEIRQQQIKRLSMKLKQADKQSQLLQKTYKAQLQKSQSELVKVKKQNKAKVDKKETSKKDNEQMRKKIKYMQQQLQEMNKTLVQKQQKQVQDSKDSQEQNREEQDETDYEQSRQIRKEEIKKQSQKNYNRKKQNVQNTNKQSQQTLIQTKSLKQQSKSDNLQKDNDIISKGLDTSSKANDSLSYDKILNSRLFKDDNRSQLSCFVDDKKFNKQKLNMTNQLLKGKYQFNVNQQSSSQDQGVSLKSDTQNEDNEQNGVNKEIFKSIPFKLNQSQIKPIKKR